MQGATSMTTITWALQCDIVAPTLLLSHIYTHSSADNSGISGRDNLEHNSTVLTTSEHASDSRSCLMTMIMRQ
eukprot:9185278-Prorocentrum_lima.AAC.1